MNAPTTISAPNLAAAVWPAGDRTAWLRGLILVLAGTGLLTLSAKTQVPFWPVPMTMQTFAVLVIGMAYGWRLGTITVVAYLAQGLAGLPVFAGGGGPAYFAGPTGGYLVGFAVAAFVVGALAERGFDRSILRTLVAATTGSAIIYLFGVPYLAFLLGDVGQAVQLGMLPFLPGAALKIALAAAVLPIAWHLVGRHRG